MYGSREGRSLPTPSQPMFADEASTSTSTLSESACLPIGCSVSAKYRGAFCSAQVKTVVKEVKCRVTVLTTGDTLTVSDDQIVQPAILRIGSIVTIRLPLPSRHDSAPHLSRSSLAAIINASQHYEEKQATIKRVYDNSLYTVVFNDGDEKSLRRSSLCLQGIRLYQNQIDQQKLLEDMPTSALFTASNDMASIVAVRRSGSSTQHAFPALILTRKSLGDYMWIKSFLDGREYIVHKRDDVHSYKNNSEIQTLCRATSTQATKACEKFIKYNQIPAVWQKKKKRLTGNDSSEEKNTSDKESNTSDTDVDGSDDDTTGEKDSFVAQLFTFMDDRGTPINNIPKLHNYDLDLHRLFKIVRQYGGYNKVMKTDQWGKVYMKMGLPDEPSSKNNRLIENAYKKYLFAYEDLSKKLGTMNAPSAYFGGRTTLSSDSRRSLIRVRQLSDEKNKFKNTPSSNKRQSPKRQSVESKQSFTPTKPRRKALLASRTRSSNIISSSSSEPETSDDESTRLSAVSNNRIRQQRTSSSKSDSSVKKLSSRSDEKKQVSGSKNSSRADTRKTPFDRSIAKKSKVANEAENDMKPVIKIAKISDEILKESALSSQKLHKRETSKAQHNTSTHHSNRETINREQIKAQSAVSDSIKPTILQDLTSLPVTPVSPSPPPSMTDESPALTSLSTSSPHNSTARDDMPVLEVPVILPTVNPPSSSTANEQVNDTEIFTISSNKRSYSDDRSDFSYKADEQLSPSKRSRHSRSSLDSSDTPSNSKYRTTDRTPINFRVTYEDVLLNEVLLVGRGLDQKTNCSAKCLEKNDNTKELRVRYMGSNAKHEEWIGIDRVLKRRAECEEKEEINGHPPLLIIAIGEDQRENKRTVELKHTLCSDQDDGIWKSLEIISLTDHDAPTYPSATQINERSHQQFHVPEQRTISPTPSEGMIVINIEDALESTDDKPVRHTAPDALVLSLKIPSTDAIPLDDHISTSDIFLHPVYIKEEIVDNSSNNQPTSLSAVIQPSSPGDHRRASVRQPKRRTFRETSTSSKKRARSDADFNSNFPVDSILSNSEPLAAPFEQQSVDMKRYRTAARRGGKRTVNQTDNENEDFPVNSLVNVTLRQQLEDMFRNRSSRYNFLDLNNDVTGDDRLAHLKDRMRQCQKVFLNLTSALTKVEKQRKMFVRRQKSATPQSTTTELLLPPSCK